MLRRAIRAIQIGHDGHGRGANWLLKQVAVRDVKCGELNLFTCENWLGDHGEDSDEDVVRSHARPLSLPRILITLNSYYSGCFRLGRA